jgi:hypothetical protein
MTLEDFQSQLLGHEQLLEHQVATTKPTSFAMFSQRTPTKPKYNNNFKKSSNPSSFNKNFQSNPPKRPYFSSPSSSQGRSYSRPPNNFNRASPFNPSSLNEILCQICGKVNHQALNCFHQMDYAFQGRHPPSDLAVMVAQTNSVQDEDNWLADSGANTHITDGLENLIIQQPYKGNETVAVGNGSGLGICHTNSSSFQTSDSTMLYLNDILLCPDDAANFISINKFCCDNDYQFILTATYFLIQDNLTRRILLQGPSKDGHYPIQL